MAYSIQNFRHEDIHPSTSVINQHNITSSLQQNKKKQKKVCNKAYFIIIRMEYYNLVSHTHTYIHTECTNDYLYFSCLHCIIIIPPKKWKLHLITSTQLFFSPQMTSLISSTHPLWSHFNLFFFTWNTPHHAPYLTQQLPIKKIRGH